MFCFPAKGTEQSQYEQRRTVIFGPSVQPGVDATLSRWRSPVRFRYGSLVKIWCGTPSAERPVLGTGVCEFESRPHYCSEHPRSVRDLHATLRRLKTRFDSWRGCSHFFWLASVTDGTVDFESTRRGSTPWRATFSASWLVLN